MPKEIGPREKALREMREAKHARAKAEQRDLKSSEVLLDALRNDIAVVRAKRGNAAKKIKKAKRGRR